jgi:hypothetical protein
MFVMVWLPMIMSRSYIVKNAILQDATKVVAQNELNKNFVMGTFIVHVRNVRMLKYVRLHDIVYKVSEF